MFAKNCFIALSPTNLTIFSLSLFENRVLMYLVESIGPSSVPRGTPYAIVLYLIEILWTHIL